MLNQIALAIDIACEEKIQNFLALLKPKPQVLKIGLEAIAALGLPRALDIVCKVCPESKIFLDFKLHDIPNTVARAIRALIRLKQIKYLTIHALGGSKMLQEAIKAADGQVNLIGVTVLTSHSKEELKSDFNLQLNEISANLTKVASEAGLKWLVASPLECQEIKKNYPNLKIVTPGIRLPSAHKGDQVRVTTPKAALELGSDLLVIGRPIYEARNPQAAWNELLENL